MHLNRHLAPHFIDFFFTAPATTEIYTLSLHDALPILSATTTESTIGGGPKYKKLSTTPGNCRIKNAQPMKPAAVGVERSEEHTSELQSHSDLVCRLLLEKKKKKKKKKKIT